MSEIVLQEPLASPIQLVLLRDGHQQTVDTLERHPRRL
jgi:hypothetical protein